MIRAPRLSRWMEGEDQAAPAATVPSRPLGYASGPQSGQSLFMNTSLLREEPAQTEPAPKKRRQTEPTAEQLANAPYNPMASHGFKDWVQPETGPIDQRRKPPPPPGKSNAELLGLTSKRRRVTKELTDEEFMALSPRQQAAVEFNTMLAEAVARDLANKGGQQTVEYAAQVGKVFSESNSPATTYAPRTVELLSNIGYQDTKVTLEDFLNLKTLITDKDLTKMDGEDFPEVKDPAWGEYRDEFQRKLAKQFDAAVKADIGVGKLADQRSDLLGLDKTPGYGGTQEDENYRIAFDMMAVKGSEKNPETLLTLQRAFPTAELFSRFMQYVDSRSKESLLKKLPVGGGTNQSYYKPEEFRKAYDFADVRKPATGKVT